MGRKRCRWSIPNSGHPSTLTPSPLSDSSMQYKPFDSCSITPNSTGEKLSGCRRFILAWKHRSIYPGPTATASWECLISRSLNWNQSDRRMCGHMMWLSRSILPISRPNNLKWLRRWPMPWGSTIAISAKDGYSGQNVPSRQTDLSSGGPSYRWR